MRGRRKRRPRASLHEERDRRDRSHPFTTPRTGRARHPVLPKDDVSLHEIVGLSHGRQPGRRGSRGSTLPLRRELLTSASGSLVTRAGLTSLPVANWAKSSGGPGLEEVLRGRTQRQRRRGGESPAVLAAAGERGCSRSASRSASRGEAGLYAVLFARSRLHAQRPRPERLLEHPCRPRGRQPPSRGSSSRVADAVPTDLSNCSHRIIVSSGFRPLAGVLRRLRWIRLRSFSPSSSRARCRRDRTVPTAQASAVAAAL